MRRASLLSLTALTILMAGCATVSPDPDASGLASSGAPQPIEGHDWFFTADGTDARLAYGVADSDDLKLGLECVQGTGRLDLIASANDGAAPEIHIESGGDTERYTAQAEPAGVHDGLVLTARAQADAPVFQRFRRLGWLAVWQGTDRQTYVPQPASADRIERFFAFCA
ncbi:hypothetical protein [Brevundimonas sp.]